MLNVEKGEENHQADNGEVEKIRVDLKRFSRNIKFERAKAVLVCQGAVKNWHESCRYE